MKHHILKLKEEFWDSVFDETKTFEIRLNDRGFQKGDTISFCLMQPVASPFPEGLFEITYVLNGWGLKEDYVALSIKKLADDKTK